MGDGPAGEPPGGLTYAEAGVDIEAGEAAVDRIRGAVASTARPEVLGSIGGFGGLFAFDPGRWRAPVLVSTTDGVGTKAQVAVAAGRYDTLGLDLVAMCVDDLVCQGAEPLFFLDYLAVGRLDPAVVQRVVAGVAEGCRQAGCALVGGEMAEHPGVVPEAHLDLAGFAVGVVERERLLPQRVEPGLALVGLPSPGLRSNGYTLARRVLLDDAGLDLAGPAWEGAGRTLADELLEPSVIYAPHVLALLGAVDVRAVAHITGGGLPGNLARVLPSDADAVVDLAAWEPPRIFAEIARLGPVAPDEMARVFNLGLGMVVALPAHEADTAVRLLADRGLAGARVVGQVTRGSGHVRLIGP